MVHSLIATEGAATFSEDPPGLPLIIVSPYEIAPDSIYSNLAISTLCTLPGVFPELTKRLTEIKTLLDSDWSVLTIDMIGQC